MLLSVIAILADAQQNKSYWSAGTPLISYRLPPPPADYKIVYIDFDNDGDPDVLRSITHGGVSVQWIDDDDNERRFPGTGYI